MEGYAYHVANLHQARNIGIALDFSLGQALHIDTILLAFADLEVDGWGCPWGEQIPHMLIVDFEVGDLDVVVGVG
jgi:hypothetical protein